MTVTENVNPDFNSQEVTNVTKIIYKEVSYHG